MLCCILGIFVVIASDTTQTYHVAIVGFLATGLVLTSSSVNSLIYSSNGAKEAAAAGHILLSMVAVRLRGRKGLDPLLMLNLDYLDVLLWIDAFSGPASIP